MFRLKAICEKVTAYTPDGLDAGYSLTLAGGATFSRAVTRGSFRREIHPQHDADGNLVSLGPWTCAYDARSLVGGTAYSGTATSGRRRTSRQAPTRQTASTGTL